MKKLLLLANTENAFYQYRRELLKHLLDAGYDVTFCCPRGEKTESLIELGCAFEDISIESHSKNILGDVRLFYAYLKLIRRLKPDAVLTFTIKPNVYGALAARLMGVPHIGNITGLGIMSEKGLLQKALFLLQRLAFQKSACVFFQNEANFSLFKKEKIIKDQGRLIPGSGANLEAYQAAEYRPSPVVKFVTVARLRQDKGYDELFEAVRALDGEQAEFHVIGACENDGFKSGCYLDELEKLRAERAVTYHGFLEQEKVKEIVAESHCLIHASHTEGMSNVILECAALARPVIASDIPGCREAVEDDISGYLFQCRDSAALAERIKRFIALSPAERRNMGAASRQLVEKKFDRKIVINAYLQEIERIKGQYDEPA